VSAGTVDLRHVWRGHVQAVLRSLPERTAYVDATTTRGTRLKIAAAVAGLEGVRPQDVDYRIYNVRPARICIEEGESEDHELRLFEIGWGGDRIVFVREPLRICTKTTRMPMAASHHVRHKHVLPWEGAGPALPARPNVHLITFDVNNARL
jgi:hypothetical protein